MQVMVFIAILTNCAILGFSSEQLMQWIPSLFSRETEGDQVMAIGSGRSEQSLSFPHYIVVKRKYFLIFYCVVSQEGSVLLV